VVSKILDISDGDYPIPCGVRICAEFLINLIRLKEAAFAFTIFKMYANN